jgi:4-hydroxythreonine-4-phosphate dehydrogenase
VTSTNRNPLVITAGEPAGIGPDLCLALAQTEWSNRVVVIADPEVLESRARQLDVDITILSSGAKKEGATNHCLKVLRQPLVNAAVCGTPDPANAKSLLAGLKRAVRGCIDGEFSGLVTAPLQKSTINDAGISFTGHTEYLAELTSTQTYLTKDRLRNVIEVLHADLIAKFDISDPEIVVCGLNPHAGESGHLGAEDAAVIEPVINEYRLRGMIIRGPLPADTAFTPAAGHADAVLAMYHDQGLPVLKYAGFGNAVNVTLGLPIIRTSVDHGTALDIAGTGKADAGSIIAAVELAAKLAGV